MKRFFFRLGGTTYDVIRHCSPDIRTKYSNLAFSLLLSTGLAAIGGFDIARQFTTVLAICSSVGILWGIAVFFFDYFIINGNTGNNFFKLIRIPVGIANVTITVIALFVLLNQSTIDSKLLLSNTNKITRCDSTYLNNKQNRYAQVTEQKKNIETYHQKNCVPEALNGYPGPKYYQKHALCVSTDSAIAMEAAELDSSEKTYYSAYQIERGALLKVSNNDFFAKAQLLPAIVSANKLVLVLAICLFIFMVYVELQSIMLKFSIDSNDEYQTNLKTYTANRKGLTSAKMDHELTVDREKILLNRKKSDEEMTTLNFDADMKAADAKALRELEIKGKIEILREKGYDATADDLEEKLKKYVKGSGDTNTSLSDIFKMTQSMVHQVDEIKKASALENLSESIFNWITNNITYDSDHNKEHYRTAREVYNEKRGVCGELSVLYMTFLRSVNIQCSFCEVTKDNTGKEVSHACIMIRENDGSSHLSDVAYKSFTIEHIEYREFTDAELQTKYENWNT